MPTPIPYAANLFDYGRTKFDKPLPINLGFAGFRLHFPLNAPKVFDEVIAFLGASYFRFLGRGQRYGMSARGLTVDAGTNTEEFPIFREFWIETPAPDAEQVDDLCAARRRRGDGRLPLRSLSRRRFGGRSDGHAFPAQAGRQIRSRAAHLDVLRRRERSSHHRRFSPRAA